MKTLHLAIIAAVVCTANPAIQQSAAEDCTGYTLIEKTIYVPQIVCETRIETCVEEKPQIIEYTVTEDVTVYETRMEDRKEIVEVPETRYRIKYHTVQKPQFEDTTECYKKSVPTKITWQGTETVVKEVPQKVTCVVTEDKGHWEERLCETCDKCKGKKCCCDEPCTKRVWVPNLVERTVEDTVMKKVTEEVPKTYEKTCYQQVPATRTKKCFTCYRPETIQSKVPYKVKVCREVTKQVPVTECKTVPVTKTRTKTVMVPQTVEKEIKVAVCKLVPKTITCRVPTLSTCLDACRHFSAGCDE